MTRHPCRSDLVGRMAGESTKENPRVFISPDHKGPRLFLGGESNLIPEVGDDFGDSTESEGVVSLFLIKLVI